MAQDLRKLFEQERKRTGPDLLEGHEDRFLKKLEEQIGPKKKRNLTPLWLGVAAAFLLLLISWGAYHTWTIPQEGIVEGNGESKEKPTLTLSDISPDLKKVETYFISSIKVELASLKVTEEQQEMVNAYLRKVKDLGEEYDNLNKELNTIGVNDMTITALIENLKIRLQLLQRLKKNLNHSKKETHDTNTSSSI